MIATNAQRHIHPDDARRAHNLIVGKRLIDAGIPVFVTRDKKPLVPVWQRLDSTLTDAEKDAIREQRKAEGKPTSLIGSTADPHRWERMQRLANREGTASICCGLAKIVVIDADAKDGKNGPELLVTYLDKRGGLPPGVVVLRSQSGGAHFVFADKEGRFRNTEGGLAHLGCNVRGVTGQIVAPGSWRADGKRYGTLDDLSTFIDAITLGTLPELPQCLVDLICKTESASLNATDERALIDELHAEDWPDYDETFGPGARFDVEKLKARSPKFVERFENPSDDISDNRFSVASHFKGLDSRFGVRDFATFCVEHPNLCGEHVDGSPGAGQFNDRNLARDYGRANAAAVHSTGEAFEAVDDDDQPKDRKKKAKEPTIAPRHLTLGGINSIEPRQFIYRKWLAKGELTILLAPGARGKSALTLSLAIDIACGIDRLGAKLARPRPVFLYNAEDSATEMERRAEAYMTFHGFTNEERELVRSNLHIQSGADGLLTFAKPERFGVASNDHVVNGLTDYIKEHDIEVVVLDPLATLHGVPENDNIGMTHVADVFKRIIGTTRVAMLIPHHVRKVQRGATTLDANDGRGASAVINSARAVLNINDIGHKAHDFQITDEPWRYVAVSMGDKVNLSPRDPSVVVYRMNSVQADNGTDEFEADNTVAISLHRYVPQVGLGDDATNEVLAALDGEEPVGSSPRHANWIGRVIADKAGWNIDSQHVRADIKAIIDEWLRRKWVVATTSSDGGKGAGRRHAVGVFKRGDERPAPRVFKFEPVNDEDDDAEG